MNSSKFAIQPTVCRTTSFSALFSLFIRKQDRTAAADEIKAKANSRAARESLFLQTLEYSRSKRTLYWALQISQERDLFLRSKYCRWMTRHSWWTAARCERQSQQRLSSASCSRQILQWQSAAEISRWLQSISQIKAAGPTVPIHFFIFMKKTIDAHEDEGFISLSEDDDQVIPPLLAFAPTTVLPQAKPLLCSAHDQPGPRLFRREGSGAGRFFGPQLFDAEWSQENSNHLQERKFQYKSYWQEETIEERYGRHPACVYRRRDKRSAFGGLTQSYYSVEELVNADISTCRPLLLDPNLLGSKSSMNQPFGFDSDFECGNLFAAYQVGLNQYDLLIQNDTNTKGYNQWFYFLLRSPPKFKSIKLNLVNFVNKNSLFRKGMKPVLFSSKLFRQRDVGWHEGSFNLSFSKNNLYRKDSSFYYTLSFTVRTQYQQDSLLIASSLVYPFSRLERRLSELPELTRHLYQSLSEEAIRLAKTLSSCSSLGTVSSPPPTSQSSSLANILAKPFLASSQRGLSIGSPLIPMKLTNCSNASR